MSELGSDLQELAGVSIDSEPIQETIRQLVSRHVAVTSTLAILEAFAPLPASIDPRVDALLTRSARRYFQNGLQEHTANEAQFTTWQLAARGESRCIRQPRDTGLP